MARRSGVQGWRWREASVLPGFGLTLGYSVLYLSLVVLLPIAALVLKATTAPLEQVLGTLGEPRVLAALRLSFGAALLAASINAVFGLVVAWVLTRYDFPGRRLLDALIDLPFALPTAVSGIALVTVFADDGVIGHWLAGLGIEVAYTWVGVTVALVLIGIPFVVRTLQPAIMALDPAVEEAAMSLGASRWHTFLRVILPAILPALLTGFTLAFARGVGEYGSVIFIAGNIPLQTEIMPLLIVIKLEQFDYVGAAVLGFLMLVLSFVMLLVINLLQAWQRRRLGLGA
ncbi:sulfate transport system permease protein [Gammaproteobacteria bacterium]|nr:sulfate ABC transporter permease subunit CysT [Gammaproteobacteria bacterium]QOJ30882.1 MAG: sulfate ABC transporter permease subunit CysT [Gammaproteobacteria bacterium]CAG0940544.1 sulfate transport system permease protein [Gammaproteobacteria bacterium]